MNECQHDMSRPNPTVQVWTEGTTVQVARCICCKELWRSTIPGVQPTKSIADMNLYLIKLSNALVESIITV